MPIQTLKANLLVILGYFIGGQLGLLIAIPPSNAAAVWPAAGIGLAAVMIRGNRVLPGILSGGILVQTTSFLDSTSTETIFSSLLIGTIVSAGGMLQACAGAYLVRQITILDPGLLRERSIGWFCILAGPVGCITSASIGMTTLWLNDIIIFSDAPLTWSTWWVGDCIGVLIFCPFILCFFGHPREIWRQRIKPVAIPLCILTLIAFIAFEFANRQEMQHVKSEFDKNAMQLHAELKVVIDEQSEATVELKEFIELTDRLTEEMFNEYAKPKLSRHPEFQALEWIPRILHKNRQEFETVSGMKIRIPDQNGAMVPAPEKELYYPIRLVAPIAGNNKALGFDIRNNPAALEATLAACTSGQLAVTDPIELVQDTEPQAGIVFYAPIYAHNPVVDTRRDCDQVSGFSASVFRLEARIKNIHKKYTDLKLNIASTKNGQVFYSQNFSQGKKHNIPSKFLFRLQTPFLVANQVWMLEFTPAGGFITRYSSWTIWLIIVGGLLIAGFSGMGLLLLTGRALLTEDVVLLRTQELNEQIRKRKQVTALLALENKSLGMIARDRPITETFAVICEDLEKITPGTLAVISWHERGNDHFKLFSTPDLPDNLKKNLDRIMLGAENISGETSADRNRPGIYPGISGPRQGFDGQAMPEYNLTHYRTTPISVVNEKILGTLGLFFTQRTLSEQKLIELSDRLANILAIAILSKQTEDRLSYQASHDNLTGLVNRREFEHRVDRLLGSIIPDRDQHAMCFLDLDQFKVVNDTCGHSAGDELLRQMAVVISQGMRKSDTVARLGGDEFAVLMEHCSLDHATGIANALQKAIQEYQFLWENNTFRVGVSIGLVAITDPVSSLSELLKQADAACYMAKDLGRNRIQIYHGEDESLIKRHGEMQWVTRIQMALTEDRFCLYAQLIEPLTGNGGEHYELLLRLNDETGTIIPPGAFLPAAERYNLMGALDRWVIQRALDILMQHPGFFSQIQMLSINLSGQSLTDGGFLEFVKNLFQKTQFDGSKICFEITETATISNLNQARNFISALREVGCRFALDDFGSGLSSFGYLKNLKVDFLKIDGLFVKDIASDPIDHAMVRSINEIGQIMGIQTIAEFVENYQIKDLLRKIGVNYVQGFGIHKPQPLMEIIGVRRTVEKLTNNQ